MNETVIIENPCYHCYMGAIGECLRCKHFGRSWAGDLEHEKIEVDSTEVGYDDR